MADAAIASSENIESRDIRVVRAHIVAPTSEKSLSWRQPRAILECHEAFNR